MKKKITLLMLWCINLAYGQLSISVQSGQYYPVPDQLLGVNTPLYPDFLTPVPPCTKCEKSNTASPCANPDSIICTDTIIGCGGNWRNSMPAQLESDADALQYRAMYYPEGVVSRYYHYVPGGKGFCLNPDEADYINQWGINSGKTNPEPWKRYCNETSYQYANFFEQNVRLCRNEAQPAESMHMVISANVYFGSWSELRNTLEYCAANDVKVDAIVFGSEIEHDQSNTPSRILADGDTIPFSSGGSYFRRVEHVFIDSIKANPLYADIPLHFATGIQHGGQGGCAERTYGCDDTLGKKSLWNRQIHEAIAAYNSTHNRPLAFAGAVNWWWNPIWNDTINPSPEIAISDMNEFFDVGLSAEGHPLCYKYPGGTTGGTFNGFDEILVIQWGIKKFTNTCNGGGYENKFIAQLFIVKRILNMLQNNYNQQYHPAASNGLRYTNAFYQRLGSNNGYNPLDFDPETNTWETENISNYAIRQVNSISGYKFRPVAVENGPAKNLEAYFLFNCMKQKLMIINYSDTAFTIGHLAVDSLAYDESHLFSYLETSVADTSDKSVLATLSETNQRVAHQDMALNEIVIPAFAIMEIELPFLQQPASKEVCNGMDDDCDSQIDEPELRYFADADQDGFGNPDSVFLLSSCSLSAGLVTDSTDCLDEPLTGASIHPGADELCNGTDDNCNGGIDENVLSVFYLDADGDSYGNASVSDSACTAPYGFAEDSSDCNDSAAYINPGAMEACNQLDDDCDGTTDEGVLNSYYADEDGDGFGRASDVLTGCSQPAGYVTNHDDCDDEPVSGAWIHPAAAEACNDLDDNCNSLIDEGVQLVFYADEDADGYGNPDAAAWACMVPAGYVENNQDCNDAPLTGSNIHPLSAETCNDVDDNCDDVIDEGLQSLYYRDADGDTYGNEDTVQWACSLPPGYSISPGDCNDDPVFGVMIHPDAVETCNELDDNCNQLTDEDLQITYFQDADGDTYGNPMINTLACSAPAGYVENAADCDDNQVTGFLIFPGAVEVCNYTDDNCNDSIDEGVLLLFYEDADGDGFGNSVNTTLACHAGTGYADNNFDCNDSLFSGAQIYPGAIEICNEADDNCNFEIDEGALIFFYADADSDGYGHIPDKIMSCTAPSGYVSDSTDCNDSLANMNPGMAELCNNTDDNCNALTDEGVLLAFFPDEDEDSFGNPADSIMACTAPDGFVSNKDDCNDHPVTGGVIHPLAIELCNALDDDCDNLVDEDVQTIFYADADGDGFGFFETTAAACSVPAGFVANAGDCNDHLTTGAMINPLATEVCNLTDDNCDGSTDEGVQTVYYADVDGDGFGSEQSVVYGCMPPNGYVTDSTDCNDSQDTGYDIHPLALEICNEADDDCDGDVDEAMQLIYFADEDGDGYGNKSNMMLACSLPAGYVTDSTDCNDSLTGSLIHPSATEWCNSTDDDCDGAVDENVLQPWFADEDGDGFGNSSISQFACSPPVGFVSDSTDCNDSLLNGGQIHPASAESCNGLDDNCDGAVDEGVLSLWFADEDGDGFGNSSVSQLACSQPAGFVSDNTDCNDSLTSGSLIYPSATEICNNTDDDCDGTADENVLPVWFADEDGDGYGNKAIMQLACIQPGGFVSDSTDCLDSAGAGIFIHPSAAELCNLTDDDCDNQMDEGVQNLYYADVDDDGFGHIADSLRACTVPEGYVENEADCNDDPATGSAIHPEATEICNGIDDNCNAATDEGVLSVFYLDADLDSYGNGAISLPACFPPEGYVADSTDCNDEPSGGMLIHPGSPEICNELDDDCNFMVDEGVMSVFYEDADGDSFGNINAATTACTVPPGFSSDSTDCDDMPGSGFLINPLATELCNAADDNCDGTIDEGVQSKFYVDEDGDGYGIASTSMTGCSPWNGYVADSTDCNDDPSAGPDIHPAAQEICNELDDDCDMVVDEEVKTVFYEDADQDSYGNALISVAACTLPALYSTDSTDCYDAVIGGAYVHPGAEEVCNEVDDNCNGATDEGVQVSFFADADGDTYGDASAVIWACEVPAGYAANNSDCNDNAATGASIHPSAVEVCNGLDDNCNTAVDEDVLHVYYADADGDTYGNPAMTESACTLPGGFSNNNLDCNDEPVSGAGIHPNITEVCNGIDDNCDLQTDEGVMITYYQDADNDTYGTPLNTVQACTTPAGYVSDHTDCNDHVTEGAAIHPGMPDLCNLIDDNCNSVTDENAISPFITPSGTIGMCTNGSLLLTANDGAGLTYQWLKNNKNISGATNKTYLAKVAGVFTVKETNAFACTATSAGVTTVIWSLPSATITALGNLNICTAGFVVLQANAGSGYLYQWIKGSNNIAGATNQQYTATTTGTYKVKVTTVNGCTKTSTGTKVTKSCKEEQGLAAASPVSFNFYPNPTDGRFIVVLEQDHASGNQFNMGSVPVTVELRNSLGLLVYSEEGFMEQGDFRHEIRMDHHLPQGMYLLRLLLPDVIYEGKVVYNQE